MHPSKENTSPSSNDMLPILIERNNTSIYSDKKVKSQQILCIGCTEKKLKEILQKQMLVCVSVNWETER